MHALVLLFLHFFFRLKYFHFFVYLYKELLESVWEMFSACLKVLYNLFDVFGCSIIFDFISPMLGFWLLSNYFLFF